MQAPQPPAAQPCATGGGAAGQEQALQQQAQQLQDAHSPLEQAAQQQAREAAPGTAATAAAEGDPHRQPGAASQAAPEGDLDGDEAVAAEGEGEEYDVELGAWLAGRLQRMQPGAELTVGSVKVLGKLLVRAGCLAATPESLTDLLHGSWSSVASSSSWQGALAAALVVHHAVPRPVPLSAAAAAARLPHA